MNDATPLDVDGIRYLVGGPPGDFIGERIRKTGQPSEFLYAPDLRIFVRALLSAAFWRQARSRLALRIRLRGWLRRR